MDTSTTPDDRALLELRAEFRGHRIWRSFHSDGRLDGWVASLHDPAAGVTPLVFCESAADLRAELLVERRRAADWERRAR